MVKGWVRQWLKYVQWYHTIALDPEVSVEAFFKAPVVTSTWKATREDPQLVRFGLMWKLYDEVAKRSLNYSPPALVRVGVLSSFDLRCLCEYLLYASGLNQPRAGRGSIHINCDCRLSRAIGHKTLGIQDCQEEVRYSSWIKTEGRYSKEYIKEESNLFQFCEKTLIHMMCPPFLPSSVILAATA